MAPEFALPSPPIVENLLLENPWPIVGALVGIAIVLLFHAWQRLYRKPVWIAMVLLLVAAGVWSTAQVVTTDRERIAMHTRELVNATIPLDADRFGSLFDTNATLRGPNNEHWLELDGVLRELDNSVARHGLHHHRILEVQAHLQSPTQGQTLLRVRSTVGQPERIVPTHWLFTWQQNPDGQWRIVTVQWLRLYGREPTLGVWR